MLTIGSQFDPNFIVIRLGLAVRTAVPGASSAHDWELSAFTAPGSLQQATLMTMRSPLLLLRQLPVAKVYKNVVYQLSTHKNILNTCLNILVGIFEYPSWQPSYRRPCNFLTLASFFLGRRVTFFQKWSFYHTVCFFFGFRGFRGGVGGWDITTQPLAALLDFLLHFHMNLMLRCLIFSCISTWTWCSAAWFSLAFLPELDAPLLDFFLHFYMNLMLRCLIFSCISTWTWCSAAWSSLAFLHELDALLLDLLLHFYLNLMLRCLIFSCISVAGHNQVSWIVVPSLQQWMWRQTLPAMTPATFLEKLRRLFLKI